VAFVVPGGSVTHVQVTFQTPVTGSCVSVATQWPVDGATFVTNVFWTTPPTVI
jgi:hypothetical protein